MTFREATKAGQLDFELGHKHSLNERSERSFGELFLQRFLGLGLDDSAPYCAVTTTSLT